MIALQLIDQIKELNKSLSKRELEQQYYDALNLLKEDDLLMIRDSLLLESTTCITPPDFDHLY
jgi:hypothetical protein